jgi:predicted transcriptional regulator
MYVINIHMTAENIQFTKIEIQIAKYLFKHYKERYNARHLAKTLDINHAHANKLCNILLEKQILVKEDIGNSTYFSYNYKYKLAIKFIEYILSLEEKEFPKWLDVLLHSLQKFKPYIHVGLVFGSSIKNKDFNDIDVLLIYDSKNSKEVKKIKEEIRKSDLIEKPIRYMDITEKDILSNNEDKVFYSIMSNNLIFYNTEKYVEVIKKCHK